MLMIPQTQSSPSPRLTPTRILSQPALLPALNQTALTESPLAANTLGVATPRLQHLPALLASLGVVPAARPPRHQRVPADTFGPGPLELDDELAKELGVPFVFVGFEEFVRLLVCEQIKDQGAQGRRGADLFVEDACVAGGGDRVGRFAEPCDAAQDVVIQRRCEQAVAEPVQVDQEEVLWTSSVVAEVAV